jgi:hypothetical protein
MERSVPTLRHGVVNKITINSLIAKSMLLVAFFNRGH